MPTFASDVFRVAKGECLLIPQNIPHTFLIRSPRYRTLFFTQPAGLTKYMRAMAAEPALELDLPKEGIPYSAAEIQHAIDEGRKYGVRFLSPKEVKERTITACFVETAICRFFADSLSSTVINTRS
jgi:hypothetical protein